MDLTGGEKMVVWVSIGLALAVLVIGFDLLTGGRVLGGLAAAPATEDEAVGDD